MRPVMILLVLGALATAGTAAFLARQFLGDQAQQVEQQNVSVAIDKVLVVARAVGPGRPLGADDLRYEDWPRNLMQERFILQRPGIEDPKAIYLGAVTRRALNAGEPLTAAAVFRQDQQGILAGMLSPGMRAISVVLTATNAAAGFVLPGDRVDIILGMDLKAKSRGGEGKVGVAETIVQDIRVLAIDTNLQQGEGLAMPGKTATLEVTPRQAEILTTAALTGALTLSLRSMVAQEIEDPERAPYESSITVSRAFNDFVSGALLDKAMGRSNSDEEKEAPPAVVAQFPAAQPVNSRVVKINRAGFSVVQSFNE